MIKNKEFTKIYPKGMIHPVNSNSFIVITRSKLGFD